MIALAYVAAFLFVFSIVVFFHEMGHFWVARACGVKVEAFSLGFGRTLVSRVDKHGTVWRVAAIPLGGYVKFFGDAGAASNPDAEHLKALKADLEAEHGAGAAQGCFHFKPVWQRAAVVVAGPVANFILAFVIFSAIIGAFGEQGQAPRVGAVVEGTPAAEAGFRHGDLITAINGREISLFRELQQEVALSSGDRLRFEVERDGEIIDLVAVVQRRAMTDAFGGEIRQGFLGVCNVGPAGVTPETSVVAACPQENEAITPPPPGDRVTERFGPIETVQRGVAMTWTAAAIPVRYVGRTIMGKESGELLGGPFRIAKVSGDVARQSFEATTSNGGNVGGAVANTLLSLLMLAGFLSVGIGLLNLLPIPILDGGHLVYYAYEAAAGKPLGEGAQEWGFRIGLALVLGLMLFATWNDLRYMNVFQSIGNMLS